MHDLTVVRSELLEEIARVPDNLADWSPQDGMRTYRGQLLEIGATERQIHGLIRDGIKPDWQPLFDSLVSACGNLQALMSALNADRAESLKTLQKLGDDGLEELVPLPNTWHDWFGVTEISKADLFRWILQHEYYHLGQIVSYNWHRGDDPYKR
jgi:uncharacterized damage-inducible protein DinB